jgi:glycogen operon protein
MPDARYYLDFTGTGNSVKASNPEAARLIVDSLRYWLAEMHVDGFRFDLAATLGARGPGEFRPDAPLFQIIAQDPVLSSRQADRRAVGRRAWAATRWAAFRIRFTS